MAETDFEKLGEVLESWVNSAPTADEGSEVNRDAQDALIEAGMVQFNPDGWNFKLHEKHPDAPKAQFKLMIREADGVDTDPVYYDRFVLPSVYNAVESRKLYEADYVVGYPNAGTPIASAFVRLARRLDIDIIQLVQAKVVHEDGTRELGNIQTEYDEGKVALAVDDTATGGDTKIEGWQKITEHGLVYGGLSLIVERDPLGTALVQQRTGKRVDSSIHWLTLVQRAAKVLDLPQAAVQQELSYPVRLFEWNVANNNLGSLPDPALL